MRKLKVKKTNLMKIIDELQNTVACYKALYMNETDECAYMGEECFTSEVLRVTDTEDDCYTCLLTNKDLYDVLRITKRYPETIFIWIEELGLWGLVIQSFGMLYSGVEMYEVAEEGDEEAVEVEFPFPGQDDPEEDDDEEEDEE